MRRTPWSTKRRRSSTQRDGVAGHRPRLDHGRAEDGTVVLVEEALGLLEGGLPVGVDVDVVVEHVRESRRVAAVLREEAADLRPVGREHAREQLHRHPAVRLLGHPPERAVHDLGLEADGPGVRGDPDRTGLLHRPRLDRHVRDRVEAAREGDVVLAPQPAADVDVLGEARGALAVGHAPQARPRGRWPRRPRCRCTRRAACGRPRADRGWPTGRRR